MIWLLVGLAVLVLGAELNVRGTSGLGLRLGLSPVVVGLTFVAFGTSAPELVVSVEAALINEPGLALGNVVGSNICNILLILGVCCLIRPMDVHAQFLRVDVPLLCVVSLVLCGLLFFDVLGRIAGVGLLSALVIYTVASIRRARRESAEIASEYQDESPAPSRHALADPAMAVAGVGLLVLGGTLFVNAAAGLAASFGVPSETIGLTIVAIGTSLPELASSLVASVRGHGDISIGNVVGSNLFNVLGILGFVAVVQPVSASGMRPQDLLVMLGSSLVLYVALQSQRRLVRWEGALLLVGYAAYMYSLLPETT